MVQLINDVNYYLLIFHLLIFHKNSLKVAFSKNEKGPIFLRIRKKKAATTCKDARIVHDILLQEKCFPHVYLAVDTEDCWDTNK